MRLEEIWYEASPYVYAALSVGVLLTAQGTLAVVSSVMLLVAAGTIVRLRWSYRRQRAAEKAAARARPGGGSRQQSQVGRSRAGTAGAGRAR